MVPPWVEIRVFGFCGLGAVPLGSASRWGWGVVVGGDDTVKGVPDVVSVNAVTPAFADITTVGVGGRIGVFVQPRDRVGLIEAVEDADSRGLPLCVIGGGSNLLVSDGDFPGVVVRDARQGVSVPDEVAPPEGGEPMVHVNAPAGTNWDDLVSYCVRMGLIGVEGLSGIPGTVGASVVQNIGAYGQEVGRVVDSVEVWDRQDKVTACLRASDLGFGYRTSLLKRTMYQAPAVPDDRFFPTPRYVVLSVTLVLRHGSAARVGSVQLAGALGVVPGSVLPLGRVRQAVLAVRAGKGMLEDPYRYLTDWMGSCRRAADLEEALTAVQDDIHGPGGGRVLLDRHSCGSFFTNPVISREAAAALPEDAPRYPAGEGGRAAHVPMVKTSAAWLIDHAGFHKGFALGRGSAAALSDVHTLALTNRGGAGSDDLVALARAIQEGVDRTFGIHLIPEPVTPGINLV